MLGMIVDQLRCKSGIKLKVPRQITQDIVLQFQRNLNHLIFQNLP